MKPRFKWRHQYDQDRDEQEGETATLYCNDPSLTQQHFTADADLNVIAKRFGIIHPMQLPGDGAGLTFRDTTQDPELSEILDNQRYGKEAFLSLPDKLRKRFHNDPNELLEFLADEDNRSEAIRLGLLNTPTPTAPSQDPSSSGAQNADSGTKTPEGPKTSPPKTPPEKTP